MLLRKWASVVNCLEIFRRKTLHPGFLAAILTSYLDPIVVLALKAGGAVAK